jgi:hypothetical protein
MQWTRQQVPGKPVTGLRSMAVQALAPVGQASVLPPTGAAEPTGYRPLGTGGGYPA